MNFFLLAHIPDFTAEIGAASPEASPGGMAKRARRGSLCVPTRVASPQTPPARRDSLCAFPPRVSPKPRSLREFQHSLALPQPLSPTSPLERFASPSLRELSSQIPRETLRPHRSSTSPMFRQRPQTSRTSSGSHTAARWSAAPSFPSQTLQALHRPYGPPLKTSAPPLPASEVRLPRSRAPPANSLPHLPFSLSPSPHPAHTFPLTSGAGDSEEGRRGRGLAGGAQVAGADGGADGGAERRDLQSHPPVLPERAARDLERVASRLTAVFELMEGQSDATCTAILLCFKSARRGIWSASPRASPPFSA